jgi:hypothetical protein
MLSYTALAPGPEGGGDAARNFKCCVRIPGYPIVANALEMNRPRKRCARSGG